MKRRAYIGHVPLNGLTRPGSGSVKRSTSEDSIFNCNSIDDWRIYTFVSFVAIGVYINSVPGEFVHDDIPAITMNKDVLGLSPIGNVFHNDFWGTPMADINSHKSYRPLTTLTFR